MTPSMRGMSPFECERLDCGLTLITKPMPGCPVFTASVWVRAGVIDEAPAENGAAHFLEHMLFKGTPTHPAGAIDRVVKGLGGYNNAATCHDSTEYYISLPTKHWARAVELLADMLLHPRLSHDDFEAERNVVLEEIGRQEDSPTSVLYQDLLGAAFEGSPYGAPILGRAETLAVMTPDTLAKFYHRCYAPDRVALIAAGDVEHCRVREIAAPLFGELAQRAGTPRTPPPQAAGGAREVKRARPLRQGYGLIGYALDAVAGSADAYALDVAAMILAGGRSSRLFRELYEQRGLVSDVEAALWELLYAGLWIVETAYDAEDHDEVMKLTREHIQRLREEAPGEAELEKAKRLLITEFLFGNEKSAAVAGALGQFHLNIGVEEADRYCDRVAAVSGEAVRDACRRHLTPDRCTIAMLGGATARKAKA